MIKSLMPNFKSFLALTSFSFLTFSIGAQAALTSYNNNGVDLVYSSVSDVTWTKDANLLGTLFGTQGFNTVVNNIISASQPINNSPNPYSPSGSYSVTASDFDSEGRTTWFGALAFVNYLNSINYGGINQWYMPDVANLIFGPIQVTNGTTRGDEWVELFYLEIGGSPSFNIPDTAYFDNERVQSYWSGKEYSPQPFAAWAFDTVLGNQFARDKSRFYFAWAVSPGQVAITTPVPEPETYALFTLGLCLFAAVAIRRKHSAL